MMICNHCNQKLLGHEAHRISIERVSLDQVLLDGRVLGSRGRDACHLRMGRCEIVIRHGHDSEVGHDAPRHVEDGQIRLRWPVKAVDEARLGAQALSNIVSFLEDGRSSLLDSCLHIVRTEEELGGRLLDILLDIREDVIHQLRLGREGRKLGRQVAEVRLDGKRLEKVCAAVLADWHSHRHLRGEVRPKVHVVTHIDHVVDVLDTAHGSAHLGQLAAAGHRKVSELGGL
mmetsp:Transcript_28167/g.63762  ORF Transcript_28167/g.63762 Transcript_28167/m.63762 type:complete len:230 (+) Transcript_28167:340-1029(+)